MKALRVAIALLLLFTVSAMAGETSHAQKSSTANAGKTRSLTLFNPMRVGSALLQPGAYKVQEVKDGDQNLLVFKKNKEEVARVACTMEQLPKQTPQNTVTEKTNDAGERVLTSVSFAGEHFEHRLRDTTTQAR